MKTTAQKLAFGAATLTLAVGCVSNSTHGAVLAELDKTKNQLKTTQTELATNKEAHEACQARAGECDEKLTVALDQNQSLVTKVSSMGQDVEQLLGEKDKMAEERKRLASEVEELRRMRAAAEARNAEFKKLLSKLANMIDAGTLEVKVRNGRMLVNMSSDVLFPPGGVHLKSEAKDAIMELAATIAQFPDRKFQIMGHSDSTPIRTQRFPSNWELSTQRAIEVLKLMVEGGVNPDNITASGAAEFDPLVPNDSPENKEMNRRVEVVFMPKIDEMPGFDQVLKDKSP